MRLLRSAAVLALAAPLLAGGIDVSDLFGYAAEQAPAYLVHDNAPADNAVTDAGATLGRVLFYDRALSLNGTVSCASCHRQAFAFGDTAHRSVGFDGALTGRHSMRLVNVGLGEGERMFWNARAATLEEQTTQPIQDHGEMGFSGTDGQPAIDSLLRRLAALERYRVLVPLAFGDGAVTEERLSRALAQFVRSLTSYDSRFDAGYVAAGEDLRAPFPNYTPAENRGKQLFLRTPGGANCQACHRAPTFDVDPLTHNNGVTGDLADPSFEDLANTRSPSLRDAFGPGGRVNGPFMHDGSLADMRAVIAHYSDIEPNFGLDRRLRGDDNRGQRLDLDPEDVDDLVAFLRTLTGERLYAEEAFADPFEPDGSLVLTGVSRARTAGGPNLRIAAYPVPSRSRVTVELPAGSATLAFTLRDSRGAEVASGLWRGGRGELDLAPLASGSYLLQVWDPGDGRRDFARRWLVRE